jgi:PAS domain S-box-containing protein
VTAVPTDATLARLLAGADDAVVIADADGVISYWNAAAERMFGFARDEAVGASLDIIVPEKLRDRHWEGYRTVMATGETRYAGRMLAVPAMRADGTRISVEFTVTLLPGETGGVAAIGAIMRDVTAAWEERRELQRELAELRRRAAAPQGRGRTSGAPAQ